MYIKELLGHTKDIYDTKIPESKYKFSIQLPKTSRKGDVISFLQQYKNCSFREALSYLDPQTSLVKTSSIAIETVVVASSLK